MKFKLNYVGLVAVALLLSACGTLNPLSHAQTAEQKAYALYGEFVVVEEQAAAVVGDSSVPSTFRAAIVNADSAAKPVADSLLDAAVAAKSVRDDLAQGKSTDEKVAIATANLLQWYAALSEKLANLVSAVKEARK